MRLLLQRDGNVGQGADAEQRKATGVGQRVIDIIADIRIEQDVNMLAYRLACFL
jgi:hypothetical protein